MPDDLTIGGLSFGRGHKTMVRLPVTVDLDGRDIFLAVHVLTGRKPGPTLALLATTHGSEWTNIEAIRQVVQMVNPAEMRGNLIAMPVGNPLALNQLKRNTPDDSDNADLNRVFPGHYSVLTEQMASVICNEFLNRADALIDFQMGLWGATIGATMYGSDYPVAEVTIASRALAKAFGWPCTIEGNIMSVYPGPQSSLGYFGGVLGRPCIFAEIGGAGFDRSLEANWLQANVRGVTNVMKHLGILDGDPEIPERHFVGKKRWRVNPSKGGYLVPEIAPEMLLSEVKEGEVLGRVISPHTFEELESLKAPGRGILYITARPYPVRPGDWAFGVIDLTDSNSRWE